MIEKHDGDGEFNKHELMKSVRSFIIQFVKFVRATSMGSHLLNKDLNLLRTLIE